MSTVEHNLYYLRKALLTGDADCYERGKSRPSQNDGSHTASAALNTSSPPAGDEGNSSLNVDDEFDKIFAHTKPVAGSGGRSFHPNTDRFTMLEDSGASDHLVDNDLVPGMRQSMRDHTEMNCLKPIVTAGNKKVVVTATGTICGYIINQAGWSVPVRISAEVVPGLGRDLSRGLAPSSKRATPTRCSTATLRFP